MARYKGRNLKEEDYLYEDIENGYRGYRKKRKTRYGHKKKFFSGVLGAEWYDYMMFVLLFIMAIAIILNFSNVLKFFYILTIRIIDLAIVIVGILLMAFVIYLVFHKNGRQK